MNFLITVTIFMFYIQSKAAQELAGANGAGIAPRQFLQIQPLPAAPIPASLVANAQLPGANGAGIAPKPFFLFQSPRVALNPRSFQITGGRLNKDLGNPEVFNQALDVAQFALDSITSQDQNAYVLERITSYSTQLVNGVNHFLNFDISDADYDYKAFATVHRSFRGQYTLRSFFKLRKAD